MCITGAAQGLGRELAACFSENYQVVIFDLNSKTIATIGEKLGCDYHQCDVSDYESVEKAVAYVVEKYHHIDCLINCAGVYIDGEIDKNDPKLMKKVIEVNSLGPINLCRYVVPHMKRRKSGTIININSTAGLHPKAYNSVYHASKWALTGFTQSLQLELANYGIKVTSIHPGVMNTKFTSGTNCDLSKSIDISEVAGSIEFVLSLKGQSYIPELVIKHL